MLVVASVCCFLLVLAKRLSSHQYFLKERCEADRHKTQRHKHTCMHRDRHNSIETIQRQTQEHTGKDIQAFKDKHM